MNILSQYHIPPSLVGISTVNQDRVLDVIRLFADVEGQDARLAIVLAGARIDAALMQALELYRVSRKAIPAKFQSRTRAALEHGLIDAEFRDFISSLRLIRNAIVHGDTRRDSFESGLLLRLVREICTPASVVPVWRTGPVDPCDDLTRSIWTASLVGVVAAELDTFDTAGRLRPKGFATVCDFIKSQPDGDEE